MQGLVNKRRAREIPKAGCFTICAVPIQHPVKLGVLREIHPALVNIPVDWGSTIPYGLLYSSDPPEDILQFVAAIKEAQDQ